jgi:PAS domain S-box-containing protein
VIFVPGLSVDVSVFMSQQFNIARKAKILAIDDNPENLKLIYDLLTECGYEVIIAKTGESGLVKAERASPDLILLDVHMPGLDGFETCTRLKQSEKTQDIPIIFLTAVSSTMSTDKVRGLQIGAVDFITKPIVTAEVLARVHIHLKLRLANLKLQASNAELKKEIEERKQIQNALFLAEKKYTNLVKNTVEGLYEANLKGSYLSANSALVRLLGYDSLGELVQHVKHLNQLYVQPNRWETLVAELETQEILPAFESLVYKKNRQAIWVSENIRAIREVTGELLYYEATVVDITLQKLAMEALLFQRQQTEQLLTNILPAQIARRLQQEQNPIADRFDEVSVLFAALIGFPEFADRSEPKMALNILNHILDRFDRLSSQHQLERIKTISDTYMVVGGLPFSHPDSISAIAQMALEMQAAMVHLNSQLNCDFRLRLGLHLGSVIAGVVDRSKLSYDLWGKTVSIARWMEFTGLPGSIQVSAKAFDRLRQNFTLEKRGTTVMADGEELTTYFLQDRHPRSNGGLK